MSSKRPYYRCKLFAAAISLLFASCAAKTTASNGDSATSGASAIDKMSIQQLGVGVNGLSLLLEADPGSAYPSNGANISKRRKALDELEANGFVTVKEVSGGNGTYLFVERTPKGEAVAEVFFSNP